MTQNKTSKQIPILRDVENTAQRFRDSILAWWERRGNRLIKFESLNVLLLFSAFFLVGWSIFAFPITGELAYSLIIQRPSNEIFVYESYFFIALAILLMASFLLFYLRRVKQYTFKQVTGQQGRFAKVGFKIQVFPMDDCSYISGVVSFLFWLLHCCVIIEVTIGHPECDCLSNVVLHRYCDDLDVCRIFHVSYV
jgi:hypothetical protein